MTMWFSVLQQALPLVPSAQFGEIGPPTDSFSDNGTTQDGVLQNADNFLSYLFGLITVLASVFFVIQFLLAAFSWVTAGGDSAKISKARDQMLQSLIGLVIVVGSYGLIGLAGTLIGLDLLNPTVQLENILNLP